MHIILYHQIENLSSDYKRPKSTCPSGVMGESKELSLLGAEESLTGKEWQKHPIVTGPEAPRLLGIDHLQRGQFKDPKGYRWALCRATLSIEKIKELFVVPGPSANPSVLGMLQVKEQRESFATMTGHKQQHHTNRDSLVLIHKLIQ